MLSASQINLNAQKLKWLPLLMSEPTAKKLCKEDMYVCPLNRDIYIYIYIYIFTLHLHYIYIRVLSILGIA